MMPSKEQAEQFALMLQTGLPPIDAIRYFLDPEVNEDVAKDLAKRWERSAAVRDAQVTLNGGEWSALTPEERIKKALEKHYAEMAYFLYTHSYSELDGVSKSKADTCRTALESKLAGMQGKMDALARFYMDQLEKQGGTKRATAH